MKFVKPVPITDAILISSTRAENEVAAWSSVTTYAIGDQVLLVSTHRVYQCVQAGNLNHDPAADLTAAWWVDIGPTNRWAMFDQAIGSVTSQSSPLAVTLAPGIVNALALLDVDAASATITMTDGAGGPTVYSRSLDLADQSILLDWYMYFFEDFAPLTYFILDDLPPYQNGRLTISLTNGAAPAQCGTLVAGAAIDIGKERHGPQIGIIDYSRKETDAYGITRVVERAYAKRFDLDLVIPAEQVDYVAQELAAIRATPVVWYGKSHYRSLMGYGWLRDWSITIAYPTYSEARTTIEGLT